jgi:hypothetical protein
MAMYVAAMAGRRGMRSRTVLSAAVPAALLLGAAFPALAADAQVAGAWNLTGQIQAGEQMAVARPVCTFQQAGAALTGTCEGPNSAGPVSGKVAGQHVTFAWRHTPKVDIGLKGVSTFDGELGADGAIQGAWTYDGLPGAAGNFRAERR